MWYYYIGGYVLSCIITYWFILRMNRLAFGPNQPIERVMCAILSLLSFVTIIVIMLVFWLFNVEDISNTKNK